MVASPESLAPSSAAVAPATSPIPSGTDSSAGGLKLVNGGAVQEAGTVNGLQASNGGEFGGKLYVCYCFRDLYEVWQMRGAAGEEDEWGSVLRAFFCFSGITLALRFMDVFQRVHHEMQGIPVTSQILEKEVNSLSAIRSMDGQQSRYAEEVLVILWCREGGRWMQSR